MHFTQILWYISSIIWYSVIYIQYNLIFCDIYPVLSNICICRRHSVPYVKTTHFRDSPDYSYYVLGSGFFFMGKRWMWCGKGRECDGYQIRVGFQWCRSYSPPTFKNNSFGHYFPPHWRHCWEFPEKVNIWFWESVEQAQLGVPHSRIQVELGFVLQSGTCQILNCAQNPRQSQSVQGTELNVGGGTPHRKVYTWRGGHRTYFLNRVPIGGDTAHRNRLTVVIGSDRKRCPAGGWGVLGWE